MRRVAAVCLAGDWQGCGELRPKRYRPAPSVALMSRRANAPNWIDDVLLSLIDGGLWHATDRQGWEGIRAAGAVLPDARVNYPRSFCRSIGAISLFDLAYPDSVISPAATHWSAWLRSADESPCFWIEIDRGLAATNLLGPPETLSRWRAALRAGSPDLRLIAHIEAAHLGALPIAHTRRTLMVSGEGWAQVDQ